MQRLKKILFVHHVSVVGGASYCILNVIKAINREKFIPIVLLRNDGPLVEELKKLNVKVYFSPTLWFYPYNKSLYTIKSLVTIFSLYRSLGDFEAVVKSVSPDIVYFNNTFLFPYLKITQKLGVKSVIHIREHWPSNQHQKQFKFIQQEILCRADRIIAINEYSAQMISPNLTKTTIVYDWIDFSERYEFKPFDKIFDEDVSRKKVYLYTGGIQRIKGAYEVIKTFSEKIKGDDCRLLVLGLTKNISVKGWKGIVKFILFKCGIPSYEYKVKSIIQNDSRIVCIPSTYYIRNIFEQAYCMLSYFTIPHANLALAEAICLQLPCIAAETEESQEYTLNGDLAFLFQVNDLKEFEHKIQELDNNYLQIKTRLKKSSGIIVEKFGKERNSELLRSVLDEL